MNWELINSNVVKSNENQFAICLDWTVGQTEKNNFRKRVKISKMINAVSADSGYILDNSKTNIIQVGKIKTELRGKPCLAGILSSKCEPDCIYFMKVSDADFWVCAINKDGSIEISSDKLWPFFGVKDFLSEKLILSQDENARSSIKIFNLGPEISFADSEIDEKVVQLKLDDILNDEKFIAKHNTHNLSGNFNKKLMATLWASIGIVGGGVYYWLNTDLEQLTQLKNGDYSYSFTSKYASANKQLKIIKSQNVKKRLDLEGFIKLGLEEYNQHVLTQNLSNEKIVQKVMFAKNVLPTYISGWKLESIDYEDEKLTVVYDRRASFPTSVNFKQLDSDLSDYLGDDLAVSPMRVDKLASKRYYDIPVVSISNPKYLEYIGSKKDVESTRLSEIAEIEKLMHDLNQKSSKIQNLESSVATLNILDKKNDELLDNIAQRILNEANSSNELFKDLNSHFTSYNNIKDVPIPDHSDTFIREGGIVEEIYPILQDYSRVKWQKEKTIGGYPNSIDDKIFKDKKLVITKSLLIGFDNSAMIENLSDLLERNDCEIYRFKIDFSSNTEASVVQLNFNEYNQDYRNL